MRSASAPADLVNGFFTTKPGPASVVVNDVGQGSISITVKQGGFVLEWPGWLPKRTQCADRTWNKTVTYNLEGFTKISLDTGYRHPAHAGIGPSHTVNVSIYVSEIQNPEYQHPEKWVLGSPTPPAWVLLAQRMLVYEARALALSKALPQALSNMKLVNINSLGYLRDVAGLVNQFRSLKKDVKRALHGSKKAFANLWLNSRYGLPLFCKDSGDLIRAYRKTRSSDPIQKYSGSYRGDLSNWRYTITVEIHVTVYVQKLTKEEMTFTQSLLSLDLFPTASNIWDLIPYSFVCDWILNVGDHLEKLDTQLLVCQFPILGAECSVKLITPLEVAHPYSADADIVTYYRFPMTTAQLSQLPFSIDASVGDGLSLKHGADGLALVVQRKAR